MCRIFCCAVFLLLQAVGTDAQSVSGLSVCGTGRGGGHLITVLGSGFSPDQFSLFDSSKGNIVKFYSETNEYECDVLKEGSTTKRITCHTRPMPIGKYKVKVYVDGVQIPSDRISGCDLQVWEFLTPLLTDATKSAEPDAVINMSGKIFTDRLESSQSTASNGRKNKILRVHAGGSACEIKNNVTQEPYCLGLNQRDDGTYTDDGYLCCRIKGNNVGYINFSISIEDIGQTSSQLNTLHLSAKGVIYNLQTYAVITSITPNQGSVEGNTNITIHGRNFAEKDARAQISVAGVPCVAVAYHDRNTMTCITPPKPAVTQNINPGGRGVAVKKWSTTMPVNKTRQEFMFHEDQSSNDEYEVELSAFFNVTRTGTYRIRIKGAGKVEVYLNQTGGTTVSDTPVVKCLTTCNTYFRSTEDYQLTKGQLIYILMKHTHVNNGSYAGLMLETDEGLARGDQTGDAQSEVQVVKFTSVVEKERQQLTLNSALVNGPSSYTSTVLELTLTNIDSTAYFRMIIFNVYSEWIKSISSASEIQAILRKVPMIGELISVTESSTGVFRLTFDTPMGNIPLGSVQTLTSPNNNLAASVSTVTPGVAGLKQFTLQLDEDIFVPTVTLPASAEEVLQALQTITTAVCPLAFYENKAAIYTENFESDRNLVCGNNLDTTVPAFCGGSSIKNPSCIFTRATRLAFNEDLKMCFAFRGNMTGTNLRSVCLESSGTNRTVWTATNLITTDSWSYTCIKFEDVIHRDCVSVVSAKLTSNEGDFWIDALTVIKQDPFDYESDDMMNMIRRQPRPGGQLLKGIDVTKVNNDDGSVSYGITLDPQECGHELPLFKPFGIEEQNNKFLIGSGGEMTNERLTAASYPLDGSVTFGFMGKSISVPVRATALEIEQIFGDNGEDVDVVHIGNCSHFEWHVTWVSRTGNLPEMTAESVGLTGNIPDMAISTMIHGCTKLKELGGDWTCAAEEGEQVTSSINGIPAACGGSCTFTYSSDITPIITGLSPLQGSQVLGTVLTVTGIRFSSTPTVWIGNVLCEVISFKSTEIQCNVPNAPSGPSNVAVHIDGVGNAPIDSSTQFTILEGVQTISPELGSLGGGTILTLTGYGFHPDATVKVGGNPCQVTSIVPGQIICTTPGSDTAGTKDVVVSNLNQDLTSDTQFTYDTSSTSQLLSASPSSSSVLGGGTFTLSGVNFGTSPLVLIGDISANVTASTDTSITGIFPSQGVGSYPIKVKVGNNGYAVRGPGVADVSYTLTLDAISPVEGSLFGRTVITGVGQGFGTNADNLTVLVGTTPCDVLEVTDTRFECRIRYTVKNHTVDNSGHSSTLGLGFAWNPSPVYVETGDYVEISWSGNTPYNTFKIQQIDGPNGNIVTGGFKSGAAVRTGTFRIQMTEPGDIYYTSNDNDGIQFYGKIEVAPKQSYEVDVQVHLNGFEATYNLHPDGTVPSIPGGECGVVESPIAGCSATITSGGSSDKFNYVFSECRAGEVTDIICDKDMVTLRGSGWSSIPCQNMINIGSHVCSVTSANATEVKCQINTTSPTEMETFVNYEVSAFVAGRGASLNKVTNPTCVLRPFVRDFSPLSGSSLGGGTMTINGVGLTNTRVQIGAFPCSIVNQTYTQINCTIPQGSVGQAQAVQVISTIHNSQYSCLQDCEYIYSNELRLISITPTTLDGSTMTTFTVHGNGFGTDSSVLAVTIGSEVCAVTAVNDKEITCERQHLPLGGHLVSVTHNSEGVAEQAGSVTVESIGMLTNVIPSVGSEKGNTSITLNGNGFIDGDTSVTINSIPCVISSTTLSSVICWTPSGTGTQTIAVTVSSSLYPQTLEFGYDLNKTPRTTGVDPLAVTGNTQITITGTGFSAYDGENLALIGNDPCPVLTQSDTEIVCTAGTHSAGTFPVSLFRTGYGRADGDFSVTYGFEASGINPDSGGLPGGQAVYVTGQGFEPETTVTICGEQARVLELRSPSLLIVETPVSTGEVVCDVLVTSGTQVITLASSYSYQSNLAAEITSVIPAFGGTDGNTLVTITGTGFSAGGTSKRRRRSVPDGVTVTMGGVPCSVQWESDTEVRCLTGQRQGSVSTFVELRNANGMAWQTNANFEYLDIWSSPTSWGGLPPPVEQDFVVIPSGQTILLDESTPILKILLIQGGTVKFAEKDIELNTEIILITDNGTLQVGTETQPFQHQATIVLHGNISDLGIPIYGTKGIFVRNGILDLHGKSSPRPWTKLAQTADIGSDKLYLQEDIGASVNDDVVVSTTGGRHSQAETEVRSVDAVSDNGKILTLNKPLEYKHLSTREWFGDIAVEYRGEVGLLTRNVAVKGSVNKQFSETIEACGDGFDTGEFATQTCFQGRFGDEVGSDQFGGQILIHSSNSLGRLSNFEISHAGQAFRLGRYPVHFHLAGDQSNSYVRGLSIHHTFNRAVNVHATSNLLIESNIIYNVMGGAFFLEDGVEIANTFENNAAIFVIGSSSLLNDDLTPAAFWATNPNNTYRHNVAAGGSHLGWWYRLKEHPEGPSADFPVIPWKVPLGIHEDNEVHSVGWIGIWIFEAYDPRENGNEDGLSVPATFRRFFSWNCNKGFEAVDIGSLELVDFILSNMETAAAEIKLLISSDQSIHRVYNNTFIGRSTLLEQEPLEQDEVRSGLVLSYRGKPFEVNSSTFYNYDVEGSVAISWSTIQGICIEDCSGWSYTLYATTFTDCVNLIGFEWEYQAAVYDIDGSLTNVPGSVVVPQSDCNPDSCVPGSAGLSAGRRNAAVCPEGLEFGNFGFNSLSPDSLSKKNAVLTNDFGTCYVPYHLHRVDFPQGYMALLLLNQTYHLSFEDAFQVSNLSYSAGFDLKPYTYVIICQVLEAVPDRFYYYIGSEWWPSSSHPLDPNVNLDGDWYYDETEKNFCYLVSWNKNQSRNVKDQLFINAFKCALKDCEPVDPNSIAPVCTGENPTMWSEIEWGNVQRQNCYTWNEDDSTCMPPTDNDNVLVPEDEWWVLDTSPPVFNELHIYGSLEVKQEAEGIEITATYIYIFKGRFIIGCDMANPFTGSVVISLKGDINTPVFQNPVGHRTPTLGSKFIAVFGALMLNGLTNIRTWTTITRTALAGSKTMYLAEVVDWNVNDEVIITATRFKIEEAEYATIEAIQNSVNDQGESFSILTLKETLMYDHLYTKETFDDGQFYIMAGEVGRITRNIRVESKPYDNMQAEAYGGHIIVSQVQYEDYLIQGYARISGVQFQRLGKLGYTDPNDPRQALVFKDTGDASNPDKPSFVVGCSFQNSSGMSLMAIGADNLFIEQNVFSYSVGSSLWISADRVRINSNLMLGFQFPGTYNNRYEASNINVDGLLHINPEEATNMWLSGNSMSSSERACIYGGAEPVIPGSPIPAWSDNTCHSSLMGIMLFPNTVSNWEYGKYQFSNFFLYKIYLYGMYINTHTISIKLSNNTLVDDRFGIFTFLIGPPSVEHMFDYDQSAEIEDSLFVGYSLGDTDCTNNLVDTSAGYYRVSVEGTAPGFSARPYDYFGISLPICTSGTNNSPDKPLNKIMNYNSIGCNLTMKGNTFANYNSDKCEGYRAVAITTAPSNDDFAHPLKASSTKWYNTDLDSKTGFKIPSITMINPTDCVDMDCDGYRSPSIKDMDGSFTETGVKSDIFGFMEFEFDGDPRRGIGNYRIPKSMLTNPDGERIQYEELYQGLGILRDESCVKNDVSRFWQCSGYDLQLVVAESMDDDTETRRLSPVAINNAGRGDDGKYLQLVNGPQDHGWCLGYTCMKRLSTFSFLIADETSAVIYFSSTSPKELRFHMPMSHPSSTIVIGVYYTFTNSLDVYVDGNLVNPKNSKMENGENVLQHPSSKPDGYFMPNLTDACGTNFLNRSTNLLYLILQGGKIVDVKTKDAITLSLDVFVELTEAEFFGENIVRNLAAFLLVPQSKVRILDIQRSDQGSARRKRSTGITTYYVEISDSSCATASCTGETRTLTYTDLETVASDVLNAFQNGIISSLLNVTVNGMSIAEVIPPVNDASWQTFVEMSTSERIVQVIDSFSFFSTIVSGAEGSAFTQQPKLHFMDIAGVHVSSLGVAAVPWRVEAVLRSGSGSNILTTLAGNTTVEFVNGWANFTDLSLSHSGSGFIIDFNIIFPESNFTLESDPLMVTLRPFKVDLAYSAGDVYTNNLHELRFKVVDTSTNTKVDNLVWNGGVWSAMVTASTTSGYQGALVGTTSANFNPGTGEVTFNDLAFDTAGVQVLTITVTSTTGYSLTMEHDVIIRSSALQSLVPDVSQVLSVKYDIDFNTYGNLDFAAGVFLNPKMALHPNILFSNLAVSEGSVVISVSVSGNTTTVSDIFTSVCSDISTGSTFTYNGTTFALSSTMTVDGQQYYGVNCEEESQVAEESSKIGLIIGLVIGLLAVLILIGVIIVWKVKILPKTKTHKLTTKEDEVRYFGTVSPVEDILWREQSFMSIREKGLPDKPMPGLSTHIGGRTTPMF